jgi:hypothetical protein
MANDALFVTIVEFVDVILAASEELLLPTTDDSVSTLDAIDDEKFVFVVLTLVIEAANEELFPVILLANPSILSAALELLVETVEFKVVIEELNDDEATLNEEFNVLTSVATEELKLVIVP